MREKIRRGRNQGRQKIESGNDGAGGRTPELNMTHGEEKHAV